MGTLGIILVLIFISLDLSNINNTLEEIVRELKKGR